jgi:hypothetical protein
VTEPARVLHDVYVHLYLAATGGYDGLDPSGGYVFYARTLLIGLGWPLLLASAAGLGLAAMWRERGGLVVTCLPLALLLALGSQRLYFARFALPALPPLLVLASSAVDRLIARRAVLGAAALAVALAPTLADSVRFDVLLTQPDTRTLAERWVADALPAEATLAVDAAPLGPTLGGRPAERVLIANDWSLFDLSPAEYRARAVDYLIVSSYTAEARALDPDREARRIAFAGWLASDATLVAQFRPFTGLAEPPFHYDQIYGPFDALDQLARPGPTLSVYRLSR